MSCRRLSQSSFLYPAINEPINILFGKSFLICLDPYIQYSLVFSVISSMFPKVGSNFNESPATLYILGVTLVTASLSRQYVFTTAKLNPSSNALLIIGYEVVGGADANPNGFSILRPIISVERSTASIAVLNPGRVGTDGTLSPFFS